MYIHTNERSLPTELPTEHYYHLLPLLSSISPITNYDLLAPFIFWCSFLFLKHDTTRMIVIGPDMPKRTQKLGPSVRGTTIKQGCATVSIVVATFCGVKAKQQNDISRYFALLDSVILIFVIDLWPIWPRVRAENREVQLGYGSVLRSPDALMASKEYSSEMESTGGQQNIWNVAEKVLKWL